MYVLFLICSFATAVAVAAAAAIAIAMRQCGRKRPIRGRICWFLPFCFLPFFLIVLWSPPNAPKAFIPIRQQQPQDFSSASSSSSSSFLDPLLCLHRSHFDIIGRRINCFPRVKGLCISPSQVKICENPSQDSLDSRSASMPEACSYYSEKLCPAPSIMRFNGERLTCPVAYSSNCDIHESRWISGLSMVADQRYLPYGKPNPHHEAEKIIPALLMQQRLTGLVNSTLYWFSYEQELSVWAQGFLKATGMDANVQYMQLPKQDEESICFEDAVVFSGPTNVWYIPDMDWNQWIRQQILKHCSIPSQNASRPFKTAAILDRAGRTRHFANKQQIVNSVEKILKIPVKQAYGGVGSFCEQVNAVVQDDILIVPHGSQNTNLIFARPGTIVIEVFPYLFYTDALRNLTHATRIEMFAVLGKRPKNFYMWFFSLIGWDSCYFQIRWCKNYARQQPITVDIEELERILIKISQSYTQSSSLL